MEHVSRKAVLGLGACALVLPLAAPASAQEAPPDGISVVAEDLAGPLQVDVAANGTIYVTEAFAGQVTQIDRKGRRSVLLGRPGAFVPGVGVHGGRVFVTATVEEGDASSQLLTLAQSGRVVHEADLLEYELRVNPDDQRHYDDAGMPMDAIANPYDVLALPGRTLIADAGGNVINQVRANGEISTLTVLPVSTQSPCDEIPNNTVSGVGCDPVPTGIALGPDGYLYVSGLGGEVEGHVWKIDARTGAIVETWSGLPPLTGIAVAPDGTVYVSSGFTDQVLRIDPATGSVTGSVAVPTATGLTWSDGRLLVTSAFHGTLFSVDPSAFSS